MQRGRPNGGLSFPSCRADHERRLLLLAAAVERHAGKRSNRPAQHHQRAVPVTGTVVVATTDAVPVA